jgi:hypothetical protein
VTRLQPLTRALVVAFAAVVVFVAAQGATANGTTLDDVWWFCFLAALLAVVVLGLAVAGRSLLRARRR